MEEREQLQGAEAQLTELALAEAYTRRASAFRSEGNVVLVAVGLDPQPVSTEFQTQLQARSTAARMYQLANPDAPLSPASLIETVLDEELVTQALLTEGHEDTPEKRAQMRGALSAIIKTTQELSRASGYELDKKFHDEILAARVLANEVGTDVAQIYENDDLHAELYRRVNTPESLVEEAQNVASVLKGQLMTIFLENSVRAQLEAEDSLTAEEKAAEFAETMADLNELIDEDEEFKLYIEAALAQTEAALKLTTVVQIEKYWGASSLLGLPEATQQWLVVGSDVMDAASTSPSTQLRNMIKENQLRTQVVNKICQLKGWDPTALSLEQLNHIRSTDEWVPTKQ